MTCSQIEGLLTRYLLGDLDSGDQARVEDHLAACPQCRTTVGDLRPTVALLRQTLSTPPGETLRLDPARRAAIFASYGRREPKAPVWSMLLKVAAGFAVLFLLAGMLLPSLSRSREQACLVATLGDSSVSYETVNGGSRSGATLYEPRKLEHRVRVARRAKDPSDRAESGSADDVGVVLFDAPPPSDRAQTSSRSDDGRESSFGLTAGTSREAVTPAAASSAKADYLAPSYDVKSADGQEISRKPEAAKSPLIMKGLYSRRANETPAEKKKSEALGRAMAEVDGDRAGAAQPARDEFSAGTPESPPSAPSPTTVATHFSPKFRPAFKPVLGQGLGAGLGVGGFDHGTRKTPLSAAAADVESEKNVKRQKVVSRDASGALELAQVPSDLKSERALKEAPARPADKSFSFFDAPGEATAAGDEEQATRRIEEKPASQVPEEKADLSADTLSKLEKIIIPEIDFRQANLHDVVDFLGRMTAEGDDLRASGGAKKNVNFVLKPGDLKEKTDETAAEITFNARHISMLSALKIITQVAGLKYRIVDGAVVIEPTAYSPEENRPATPSPPETGDNAEPAAEAVYPPQVFNPIVETRENEFSTFGIDVDTASFTLARRHLLQGKRPPEGAVRVEEFVNAFDYAYRSPESDTFAVYADRARSPFRPSLDVLRIGVRGKVIGRDRMRPSSLTFVIDTSGSMNLPDRLVLIRKSLGMLVDHLGPQDSVAVVAFGSEARLVLDRTPATQKDTIRAAIDGLQTYGSTHLEGGLRLGYEVAARNFRSGALNRVLLLSDGVANLGAATAQGILAQVESYKNQGIYCSVFGVGQGTYNDTMLETLADKGDGVYRFVDSLAEARRVFVDDLAATLCVIAKDVKIQVQFDPARVTRYRQIGYENRHLEKEQFRDDTVDAGEVGSGQTAVALYEMAVAGNPAEPLGTVRLRWKDTETGRVEERAVPLKADDRYSDFEQAPVRFRLAAGVAELADLLRRNPNTAGTTVRDVAAVLRPVGLELSLDPQVQDLVRMVNAVRE
jgi:Ca-activated chloride channel family protein